MVELKRWFENHATRFRGPDPYINDHLEMKRKHTWRTCEEILYLASRLHLDENETRIAEAIALLHDVGRFPQFATYRTFNDAKSVNHGSLGIEILKREGILDLFDAEERAWVETAIECHGHKSLPDGLKDPGLFFLKLIRDADKLDIFRLAISRYKNPNQNGGISPDLPDGPDVSEEVRQSVLAGRLMEYKDLRNLNDFKLCQIGWVYDINFVASLERLETNRTVDQMFSVLPHTDEIAEVERAVRGYIDARIAEGISPAGRLV